MPLHLLRLAQSVREAGFAPAVVSLASPGPVGGQLAEAGIEVLSCAGRGGWDFRILGRLRQILRDRRPDLVHALLFHANQAVRWVARSAGVPVQRVLCEIQTVEVERRWHLWVDRFTYRSCRCTIGNSPSVVEHLAKHAGIPRDRLRLIRGGIDPAPIQQAEPIDRISLGVRRERPLVLWVGRLDPVKGLPQLIEAFRAVRATHDAQLLLVGEGQQRAELEAHVLRARLQGHVYLPGSRGDVPAVLKAADVFVLPSRTEGLPNALLEAMAAGCAIVTTDVPGCRDLVRHEETGLVVPFGDTTALASAIARLLSDRQLANSLGAAAATEVAANWTAERMRADYLQLYREALADQRPAS